ncbi:type II toxin-antitoxin system VapC family toxin [Candidatus Sumerlaeota bacterium]|nr:type II toxin-antitoxin system VapC family toxin [Candidatus Sumerlaeota bacterium]
MKEKVYIDSTIPSYYFDERESLRLFTEITRRWWKEESGNYEIWISGAVFQELGLGNYPNKEKVLELIQNIPFLDRLNEVEEIAQFYMTHFVMPQSLAGDAVHLAYASFYKFDYLLTWNCNHLANANKQRHIKIINGQLGLSTPQIITPMELFQEQSNDNE